MERAPSANYETRAAILALLSDEEVARVSTAEAGAALAEGDEYIDLHALDRGVLRACACVTAPHHLVPRKAVREGTWKAILRKLPAS